MKIYVAQEKQCNNSPIHLGYFYAYVINRFKRKLLLEWRKKKGKFTNAKSYN